MRICALLCLWGLMLSALPTWAAGAGYKCVDAKGKTSFQDRPCAPDQKESLLKGVEAGKSQGKVALQQIGASRYALAVPSVLQSRAPQNPQGFPTLRLEPVDPAIKAALLVSVLDLPPKNANPNVALMAIRKDIETGFTGNVSGGFGGRRLADQAFTHKPTQGAGWMGTFEDPNSTGAPGDYRYATAGAIVTADATLKFTIFSDALISPEVELMMGIVEIGLVRLR